MLHRWDFSWTWKNALVFTNPQMKWVHFRCRLRQFQVDALQLSAGDEAVTWEKWRWGELPHSIKNRVDSPRPCLWNFNHELQVYVSGIEFTLQRKQVFSFSPIIEGRLGHSRKKKKERGTNIRNINFCFRHVKQTLGLLTHRITSWFSVLSPYTWSESRV